MKIVVETIPHDQHRYPTVGDYWIDGAGTIQVRVSQLSSERREMAVLIHELFEMFAVTCAGIALDAIDAFDTAYEASRDPVDLEEPGDQPDAPYYRQHQAATIVERFFIEHTGDHWQDYDHEIAALP